MGDFDGHPFRGNQYSMLISEGRGTETPRDRDEKMDPLSVADRKITDRQQALQREIWMRAGPGNYDLPRGVGSKPRVVAEWTPAKDVTR
jgi:hypothetical protein